MTGKKYSGLTFYVLRDREVVPESNPERWSLWLGSRRGTSETTVAAETVGTAYVSTVFIGIDLSAAVYEGPPQVFETAVFVGGHVSDVARYSTWGEAERGHRELVKKELSRKLRE
jgi:hypothetical protein